MEGGSHRSPQELNVTPPQAHPEIKDIPVQSCGLEEVTVMEQTPLIMETQGEEVEDFLPAAEAQLTLVEAMEMEERVVKDSFRVEREVEQ